MKLFATGVLLALAATAEAQVGPQTSITCPPGATYFELGSDIASADTFPEGTTFCVRAGLHVPDRPINLRAGQSLIGEFGAIIDGTNVTQGWDLPSTSIVRGWNCSQHCNGVTVRNLVIRNLAAYNCVGNYGSTTATADNWTIDHNEIRGCRYGVSIGLSSGAQVTNNRIVNNTCWGGGYRQTNTLWDSNDISGSTDHSCKFGDDWLQGGTVPDLGYMSNVRITRNNFHDLGQNTAAVWMDFLGGGNVICDNKIDGSSLWPAVDIEGVLGAEVCRNTIRVGSSAVGIWLTGSQYADAHHNVITAPAGGGARIFRDAAFPYFPTAHNRIRDTTIIGPVETYFFQCTGMDEAACVAYMSSNDNTVSGITYMSPPDTVNPVVTLNVTRNGNSTNYTATSTASDNVAVTRFELRLDGALMTKAPGPFTLSIKAKGTHLVTAQAWDAAGNTSGTVMQTVTVR
jgi:parallel beta-helix repeat protein